MPLREGSSTEPAHRFGLMHLRLVHQLVAACGDCPLTGDRASTFRTALDLDRAPQ